MVDQNPTVEQVEAETVESESTGTPLQENVKSRTTWLRLLFIVIYCALLSLAGLVGTFVVVVGFFWVLFTGEVNQQLRQVGQAIAGYIYEIVRYLTYNTDDKPFPFGGAWPSGPADDHLS